MARTCGNCQSRQGPFDRAFVGFRRTGQNVYTCRVPQKNLDGTRTTEKQRIDSIHACHARKEALNASA